jgi:hypothetical protein
MLHRFPCPYLNGEVELTEERERHITERHPDLPPEHRPRIAETLGTPDQVRTSARFGSAKLFSRWYPEVRLGKHVVVVSEHTPQQRHWIITYTSPASSRKGEWNGSALDVYV